MLMRGRRRRALGLPRASRAAGWSSEGPGTTRGEYRMPRALEAREQRLPARLRAVLLAGALAVLALTVFAPVASASILGPRPAHSPNAADIRTTYWVLLVVAVILALVVNGALVALVMRNRSRRGEEPPRLTAGRGFFLRAGVPL